ncbi:MAG: FHA domain-containing protein [Verrucomicrobiales bacterium]|jgi:pSer/pThr/pTyr-binding forkhead associated (FHA) protein|nr:FHA domain-containing protein [Verrucomicrobiales bacterium]
MARLIAQTPELAGQIYELDSPLLTFGRAEDNVLSIPHGSISSHHGEFRLDGSDYRLVDIGSTNGSKVNDAPVTNHLLRHGDLVMLGNALFEYQSQAPTTAAPTAPLPPSGERIALGMNQSGVGRPASFVNLVAISKPSKSGGKKLPLLLIIGIVVVLLAGGYLAYSTFMS